MAVAQHLPRGRNQAGDRHLKFHDDRDNLRVEGTGSYGAALARHLTGDGVQVLEVARPNRQVRRRFGKTDVVDAIAAARAVQSGEASGTPKSHDGPVEALRTLKAVQRSANKARTQALNQIHQLLVTAPDDLRARLLPLKRADLLATCAAFRISPDDDSLPAMTRLALRELAQRIAHLSEQLTLVGKRLHAALWRIVIVRLSCDQRTRDYLDKRTKEGKSKTEAIRAPGWASEASAQRQVSAAAGVRYKGGSEPLLPVHRKGLGSAHCSRAEPEAPVV